MRRRQLRIAAAMAAGVVVVAFVLQQVALRDLRRLEAAYIAAREPTACATQGLLPGAFSEDQSQLPETVLALVTRAYRETVQLDRRYHREDHVLTPLPALQHAEAAIGEALRAQVALYDAMVNDPDSSEAKLHTLGLANTRAERQLGRARRRLLASETQDWRRRFVCDHEV
ncbi:MAG TPA: hypothetical protein VM143_07270 [Acidimicrobiales bacterium]|nr:hypothetical protein [Acidimicrobiales bacterium]